MDHTTKRSTGLITVLDLTKDEDLKFLLDFLKAELNVLVYIHLAPPCGTASAARGIPVPGCPQEMQPVPLRTKEFPDGLPGLTGLNLLKVEKANALYQATAVIVQFCVSYNILVSIENPLNSLFWQTKPMVELFESCEGFRVVFDSCMMGGQRDKATLWWCNKNIFSPLALRCSRDHQHKNWTPVFDKVNKRFNFPTAEEAAYPEILCDRVENLVDQALQQCNFTKLQTLEQQIHHQRSTATNSILMGLLPRGRKLLPLVSEFQFYRQWLVPPHFPADDLDSLLKTFPKGARIVSRKLMHGGDFRVCDSMLMDECSSQRSSSICIDGFAGDFTSLQKVGEILSIGIPREPDDFVARAVAAGHPRNLFAEDWSARDPFVLENLSPDRGKLLDRRNAFFRKWLKRASELASKEKDLHDSLDQEVARVLKGKRLLVLEEILNEIGFPDRHLVKDICEGFRITGWLRDSMLFPHRSKPPQYSVDALLRLSKGISRSIFKSVNAEEATEASVGAWEGTLNEIAKGWLTEDKEPDLDKLVVARRFGLVQKSKVRVIDDFKQCGVNGSAGLPEKYVLHSIDAIAATLVRALSVGLPVGETLCGTTFDLVAAYKQYAIHPEDRERVRICVKDVEQGVAKVYKISALPFGASGSVAGFLRISAALACIGQVCLGFWWSSFFDDFPTLSMSSMAAQCKAQVHLLFDLLGIDFAREGDKAGAFEQTFKALGLRIDLTDFSVGKVRIGHTDSRRQELLAQIEFHLDQNCLKPKDAERLRGRLQWYDTFLFGRVANYSMSVISKRATSCSLDGSLDPQLQRALSFLKGHVSVSKPVELSKSAGKTYCIFTDGAVEPTADGSQVVASVGGILYNTDGEAEAFFSEKVPQLILDMFLQHSSHPIFEVELLAVLVAAHVWAHAVENTYVVFYIDNEAAKSALMKNHSSVLFGNVLTTCFAQLESEHNLKVWFGRVPSFSNPADSPSRFEIQHLLDIGSALVKPSWDQVLLLIERKEQTL